MNTHSCRRFSRRYPKLFRHLIVLVFAGSVAQSAFAQPTPEAQGLKSILDYISNAWDTLTRSMTDCQTVGDPKIKTQAVLYLPYQFPEPPAIQAMAATCNVQVKQLPIEIQHLGEITASDQEPSGVLYLPNKYVVPGGRFNEMYGWDSYFIIRGLLEAGRLDLARGMAENFLFEIEHYGAMLNANRTYYLTRSQPPFVSSAFVDVYRSLPQDKQDKAWLERAYSDISKEYAMWTSEPHLAGDTGLSRYFDFGEGPAAEAIQDEAGTGRRVSDYFFLHPTDANGYIVDTNSGSHESVAGPPFTMQVCDAQSTMAHPDCEKPLQFKLSADYYKGDRSMRESGFDVSSRFGPFGAGTHHYAPVCLNSLLYKTEKDLEQISLWLGRSDDAKNWSNRAEERKRLITKYLWSDQQGQFFDFNFTTNRMSTYKYLSTFYPLWAGLATPQQAKAVAANVKAFEHPGGLAMSTVDAGTQWDLPYGWGNIHMLAVEGLRRYGFKDDADRISYEFLSNVAENFRRYGNIREKYNVVTRSSESHIEAGYNINVIGFGWTNAAFLELLHRLPKDMVERLEKEQDQPPTAK